MAPLIRYMFDFTLFRQGYSQVESKNLGLLDDQFQRNCDLPNEDDDDYAPQPLSKTQHLPSVIKDKIRLEELFQKSSRYWIYKSKLGLYPAFNMFGIKVCSQMHVF